MKTMDAHPSGNFMYGANTILTAIFIAFGGWLDTLKHVHVPPIFIEVLMCLSYAGGFTVAAITVYKFIKERKKKK